MTYYTRDGGGSPPPPSPPSGTAVDNDNSGPTQSTLGSITLLALLSYHLCKRALDSRKEFESSQEDISSASTHVTPDIDSSFDASSSILDLANTSSLIVEVQPTLDSYEDFIGNESVPFVSLDIAPVLEIALSASPPPAAIEFWDADVARRISVALYEPTAPASPNVLLFHDISTCSVDDKPTPSTISALFQIMKLFYTLFTVFLCGIVVYLWSYITFSGFNNDAAPEDIAEAEVSFVLPKNCASF